MPPPGGNVVTLGTFVTCMPGLRTGVDVGLGEGDGEGVAVGVVVGVLVGHKGALKLTTGLVPPPGFVPAALDLYEPTETPR